MLPVLAAAYALAIGASALCCLVSSPSLRRSRLKSMQTSKRLAARMFQKAVSQLSRSEFDQIADKTKKG